MNKGTIIITGIFSLLISYGVIAEQGDRILAEEYITLSKVKETFDATIEVYVEQMSTAQPNEKKEDIRAYFQSIMGWDLLKEPTIKIAMKHFTTEELKGINAFYKTKAGQAFANKSPAMAVDISNVMLKNLEVPQ